MREGKIKKRRRKRRERKECDNDKTLYQKKKGV